MEPTGGGLRRGVRIGVDVGDVRVGIALCDPHALLATPLETVTRGKGDIERILDIAVDHEVLEVVVGLPRSLAGGLGRAADKAVSFAEDLQGALSQRQLPVSVRLVDERLTTVSAERELREAGKSGVKRRAVVDQAAAVVILQHALDAERSTGRPPGQEVGQVS